MATYQNTTENLPKLKYGDTLTDASGKTLGTVKYDYKTGKALTPPTTSVAPTDKTTKTTSDPTITSDTYRSSIDALNRQISDYSNKLKRQNDEDVSGIKQAYEAARVIQEARQQKDYAGRSTGLVTSGGGFLGATQSHEGVLQNLKGEQDQEAQALMAKRDAAIQASRNAYDSKAFALSMQQLNLAKDAEQQLYDRQRQSAQDKLTAAREARAQEEYDRGVAKDKLEAYAMMPDEEFAKADTSLSDALYFPGYSKQYREIAKKAQATKSIKDELEVQNDLYTLLNKVPAGRKVTIGGKNYVGTKPSSTGVSLKDVITPDRARVAGLPTSVEGMKEKDIILSLELTRPASWFITALEEAKQQSLSDAAIAQEWNTFRNDPDMVAYRNTIKLDKRNSINSGENDLAAAIDAIAGSDNTE